MHILITAGPTREYLDPVRFLSNGSTGAMGYACARAARRRGHQVTLISGPVALRPPAGVDFIPVASSEDMRRAVKRRFRHVDCVIMTAAVADYKPAHYASHKLTKTHSPLTLKLVPTVDILAELGRTRKKQILIGFALQDQAPRKNAQRKLATKNLDAIILNHPQAIGAATLRAEILSSDGSWQRFPTIRKTALAQRIVKLGEAIAFGRPAIK